jgi:alkanesulfonate monooxygenase SsuD/methylene tetrahydromethanopterin reductase-like flavin-dependent oxidoreductase (luciferase family)
LHVTFGKRGGYPDVDVSKLPSRGVGIVETAQRERMTVREVYEKLVVSKGHRQLIGTAMEGADDLQEWFEEGGADGFNIMPAQMPDGLNDFAELVIPELQRRGLFRKAYAGTTLRQHLGVPNPGWGSALPAKNVKAAVGS